MTGYFYFSLLGKDSQEMCLSPIKKKFGEHLLQANSFQKLQKNIRVYLHQEETFQCGLKLALLQVPQKVPVTDFDTD